MGNLYEQIQQDSFRQLECDGILFVEYQCVPKKIKDRIWSQHSHITYVMNGKKT
jgi:hypothetical protein